MPKFLTRSLNCRPPDGGFGDAAAFLWPISDFAGHVGNTEGSIGNGGSSKYLWPKISNSHR